MGGMKNALEDWLEIIGYDLGYDMENYPEITQWENVKIKRIYRSKYGRKKDYTNIK